MNEKIIKIGIVGILMLMVLLGLNYLSDSGKGVVSGNEHIYNGQTLSQSFSSPERLEKLSERASYLDTTQRLIPEAKSAVEQLIRDAENDGMCLVVYDSYRSKERQKEIFEYIKEERPDKIDRVALPNQSEHRTGMAVDFAGCPMNNGKRDDSAGRKELEGKFKDLPEYQWLKENAHKYNLEQSFKKSNESVTGFDAEPWHWKFIK